MHRHRQTEIISCTACDYREQAQEPVPGIGPDTDVKLIIVGQNPGPEENTAGEPFIGTSGQILREALPIECGLQPHQCYITNAVKCYTTDNKVNLTHVKLCAAEFLKDEIMTIDCPIVLLLGKPALQSIFPTYTSILAHRGQLLTSKDYPGKYFLPTVHPAALLRQKDYVPYFSADMKAVGELVQQGVQQTADVKYWVETLPQRVEKVLRHLMTTKLVAFDIETTSLDPFAAEADVTMISFSDGPKRSFVIPVRFPGILDISPKNFELLRELLEDVSIKKIAHNAVFDVKYLHNVLGINVKGLFFDTMFGIYLFDENRKSLALKNLAAEFTDLRRYEDELTTAIGVPKLRDVFTLVAGLSSTDDNTVIASEEFLDKLGLSKEGLFNLLANYSAKDADATYRVYEKELDLLKERPNARKFMNLMLQLTRCVVDMESAGWPVDKSAVARVTADLAEVVRKKKAELFAVPAVKRYNREIGTELNPNSPKQKALLLTKYGNVPLKERTPTGTFTTKKEVLAGFASTHPLCSILVEYNKLAKLASTYTENFFITTSDDGKLRTNFKIAGTVTGRFSSSGPNMQNIPSRDPVWAPVIKRQFVAPEGMLLMEADFSQVELRIFADYADSKIMKTAFQNGEDLHRRTASALYDIPEEDVVKGQRYVAKTANFALIYGISPKRFQLNLLTDGGINIDLGEAKRLHNKFFDTYPAVALYHRMVEQRLLGKGYLENRFGRRRNLPQVFGDDYSQAKAFREGYNFLVQSTASDLLLQSLIAVRKRLSGTGVFMVGMIHDSIQLFVPKELVHATAVEVKSIMESFEFPWNTVPILSEIEVGPTWGDLEEYEV